MTYLAIIYALYSIFCLVLVDYIFPEDITPVHLKKSHAYDSSSKKYLSAPQMSCTTQKQASQVV